MFLLQDLNLIFEKSHHLDLAQKAIYCKQIQEHIEKINAINEELDRKFEASKDYSELFGKISNEIKLSDSVNAQKTLNNLKTKIVEDKRLEGSNTSNVWERQQLIVGIAGIMTALASLLVSFFQTNTPPIINQISQNSTDLVLTIITSLIAAFVVSVVIFFTKKYKWNSSAINIVKKERK